MSTFNMQEFNEILEKCKDQSQQQKQDQVRTFVEIINRKNSYQWFGLDLVEVLLLMNIVKISDESLWEGNDYDNLIYF